MENCSALAERCLGLPRFARTEHMAARLATARRGLSAPVKYNVHTPVTHLSHASGMLHIEYQHTLNFA